MDYSRTNKLFTKEELASLSKGDSQNLVYDISQMDPRDFFPLIFSAMVKNTFFLLRLHLIIITIIAGLSIPT